MDNYLLSSLRTGEDVSLQLSSDSFNFMQLFNQDTRGTVLDFTVDPNITYGVRVLGQQGENYNLSTDTGLLFDSTVVEFDQPLTASLVTSDTLNMFARNSSSMSYYGDGYFVSADKVVVGDTLTMEVESTEFIPSVYLINAETGQLIDDWRGSQQQKTINFTVEEDIDYLIMVSSIYANQLGEYTFSVDTN